MRALMKIHSVVLRGGKQFEGGNAIQQKLHGSSQIGMLQNFFSAFRKYCQKQTREWPLDDSGPHLMTDYFSQVQMTQLQMLRDAYYSYLQGSWIRVHYTKNTIQSTAWIYPGVIHS